jgi:[ribosomal protein S18]-alanine N-acetyltransferase
MPSFLDRLWISKRPTFKIPSRRSTLPDCQFRLIRPSDFSVCEDIFSLNEPKHFPPSKFGAMEMFKIWLRSGNAAIVVVECDGQVRGLGGISVRRIPALDAGNAWLGFGMIHPEFHGKGLGTALLLCRMSLLPESLLPCTVVMQSAGDSYRFYKQFGFRYIVTAKAESLPPLDFYRVQLMPADRRKCRLALDVLQLDRELLVATLTKNLDQLNVSAGCGDAQPGEPDAQQCAKLA